MVPGNGDGLDAGQALHCRGSRRRRICRMLELFDSDHLRPTISRTRLADASKASDLGCLGECPGSENRCDGMRGRLRAAFQEVLHGKLPGSLGRYERAVVDFDEAIRLNPASPLAFSNRCFARGALDQLEQALTDCSEALRLKPKNSGAHGSRGFIYLRLRRYEAAIADFNLKLQANPDDAYALFGRGVAKYMKSDLRGGDGDIVAAQALKPDISEDMAKLGIRIQDVR